MNDQGEAVAFDEFAFYPRKQTLFRDGTPLELGGRALEVLSVLLEAGGELVSKSTLMDRVWPGIAVEENNIQVQVSALRRALGEKRDLIRTIPGRGYRFTGTIEVETATAEVPVRGGAAGVAGGALSAPLSIVVLPFVNLSAEPGLDYLVDGLTDSLTTDLSRVLPGSFVVSRSTAFSYKGRGANARSLGEHLGVRYVLEGSVLPTDEMIRVNARLTDTVTDTSLWAERFDKPAQDILQVQDEIVGRLSRAIGIEMTRREASRLAEKRHPEAVDLALRGRAVVHGRMTAQTAVQAMALFRRALELEPAHAEALVGLASVLVYQVVNFYRPDRDAALGEADALLERTLVDDPTHLGALRTRGIVMRARGDFSGAIAVNEAVVAQNPGEPTTYREIGLNHLYLGEFAEAVSWFSGAERIAPLDPIRWTWLQGLGRALIALGQDQGAVRALRLAVESRPGVAEIYGLLAAAEALAGRVERAREQLADYVGREPGMTVQRWASRSHVPLQYVSRAYLMANERVLAGLRLAGLPEG